MARPKQQVVREVVNVTLTEVPAFAFTADHPALKGHAFIGLTREQALSNARAELAHRFPAHKYELHIGGFEE